MLQKVHPLPFASRSLFGSRPSLGSRRAGDGRDPAGDAARLLGWIGLAALMVGAPLVGVLSRRAFFVLLPVGGGILAAGYVLAVSTAGLKTLGDALRQPIGMAAVFLVGWTGLSLAWTPYLGDAGPRFAGTLAVTAIAALIIAHLPERQARPTLHLLPSGLAITAAATLGMTLVGPSSFRGGTEFDPSLLERSLLTMVVLVWPALGALGAFGRWRLGAGLAALVAGVIFVAFAQLALAAFALGALAFALAVESPGRVARVAAGLFAGLVLLAPVLPFALAPLAASVSLVGKSTVTAMSDWRDLVQADGLRLITGHGFDTVGHGTAYGYLPAHTPRSVLFEVWYELGVLGALALAAVFALGLLAAARAARFVAPALIAGIVSTLTIAIAGVATAELWFVTLVSLQAIAFGLLARSSREAQRPIAGPQPSVERGATIAAATLPHM